MENTKERPATFKQRAFMDELEIEYDDNVTLEEASEMISEELMERRENDDWCGAVGSDPEWYKS